MMNGMNGLGGDIVLLHVNRIILVFITILSSLS
jgi:hypothetical protein